jgi:ABC-type transport system involved in multi-copper enzyme maturation permease subunit
MLSPILYDFRKTILSKGLLAVIAIVAIIGLALIPLISPMSRITFGRPFDINGVAVYDNETLKLVIYVYDRFGDPLSDVGINITLRNDINGKTVYDELFKSGEDGFVRATIDVGNITDIASLSIDIIASYMEQTSTTGFPLDLISTSGYFPLRSTMDFVTDPHNMSRNRILVFAAARDGGRPSGYRLYYFVEPNISRIRRGIGVSSNGTHIFIDYGPTQRNVVRASEAPLLATIDDYVSVIDPDPLIQSFRGNLTGILLILASSDNEIINYIAVDKVALSPGVWFPDVEEMVTNFVLGVLSGFVPLMAIVASYYGYGSDRLKGYLEMVLARPVTRLGLSISRHISIILALTVSIFLLSGAMDLAAYYVTGKLISADVLGTFIAAFILVSAIFTGLMLMFSHIVRSTGALLGLGIGIWLGITMFWGLIIYLVASSMGISLLSEDYMRLSSSLSLINPTQYPNLFDTIRRGYIMIPGEARIDPAKYGVTIHTVALSAILWVVIPLAIYLYLATRRD